MATHRQIESIRLRHRVGGDARVGVKAAVAESIRTTGGGDDLPLVTATVTTSGVDLDGEVVVPKGIDVSYIRANKSILYNHDANLPVGTLRNIRLTGKGWVAQVGMARTEFARDVFTLIEDEALNGTSIGFIAEEARRPTKDEVKEFGDHHTIIPKARMLEFSFTAQPCNPAALIHRAGGKGLDDAQIGRLDDALTRGRVRRKSVELMGLESALARRPRRTIVCVG